MKQINEYKMIFDSYGGMMRTRDLQNEKILYRTLHKLIEQGFVEKVRYGYYRWINLNDFSEVCVVIRLFPEAILCMETALRYYGYSDRNPLKWHLAVSRDFSKSRFNIDYPFVKPHYVNSSYLEIGLSYGVIDGHKVRIYDKERVICDCMRFRNRMDKEIFNKAILGYINDQGKNIPRLMEYAEELRVKKTVKELIGVWL